MGDATTRSLPPLPPNATSTPRSLKRLSLSSHAPLLRELVPTSSPTPSRSNLDASTQPHSPTLTRIATDSDSTPLSPPTITTPLLSTTPTTAPATTEGPAKATPRHSKRSSISYSSSPTLSRSASLQRITPSSTPSTPITDRFASSTPSDAHSSNSNSNSVSNSTTLEGGTTAEGGFLSSNRTGAGMGAQPSLVELNFNLLSFIAAKERKCLDLREELKRNEGELTALKKKWEMIVAQSVSPPSQSTRSTASPSDSSRSSPRHPINNSTNNPFDLSKPLPRQRDHSKMTENENPYSAAEIELGESVQAAKKWMGGVFGKVLEAVSGLEEESTASNTGAEGRLLALKEEDEPEEAGQEGRKRESTVSGSSMEGRRTSGTSSRVSLDSAASSYVSKSAPSTTPTTSPTIRLSSSKFPAQSHQFSALPTSDLASSSSSSSIGHQSPSQSSEDEKSPLQSRMEAGLGAPRVKPIESNGHNRRRSTFDMLGSAAGGGWNSIGKRWAGLTESETFQNSKRATLGFVDSIEKGIVTTLGPLDPPSTTPTSSPRLSSDNPLSPPPTSINPPPPSTSTSSSILNWGRGSSSISASSNSKEEREKTPKQGEANWDWSSFLEGPAVAAPIDLDEPPTEQRLGGYRRPSLTPALVSGSSTTIYPPPLNPTSPSSRTRNKVLPISPSLRSGMEEGGTATGSTPKSLTTTTRKGSPNRVIDGREKENGAKGMGIDPVKEEEDGWGW